MLKFIVPQLITRLLIFFIEWWYGPANILILPNTWNWFVEGFWVSASGFDLFTWSLDSLKTPCCKEMFLRNLWSCSLIPVCQPQREPWRWGLIEINLFPMQCLHLKKMKIIFLGIFDGFNWNVNNFQVPYFQGWVLNTVARLWVTAAIFCFLSVFRSRGSYLNLYWSITIWAVSSIALWSADHLQHLTVNMLVPEALAHYA